MRPIRRTPGKSRFSHEHHAHISKKPHGFQDSGKKKLPLPQDSQRHPSIFSEDFDTIPSPTKMASTSSSSSSPSSPLLSPTSKQILQAQAREVLSQQDPSALSTFLEYLYSEIPSLKSHAETLLNYLKKFYLNSFTLCLGFLLLSRPVIPLRDSAFDLLSRLLTRAEHRLWPKLAIMHRNQLKPVLLDLLKNEHSRLFLSRLRDFVSEIASEDIPGNEWPELIELMFQSFSSNSESVVENGLLLLAKLAQGRVGERLVFRMAMLHEVLTSILDSEVCLEVKVAAIKASLNFVLYLATPSNQDLYQDLLILMMKTFFLIANEDQQDYAQSVLEELIVLAGANPGFFSVHIDTVIECMLMTAENADFEEKTRLLAVEFVHTMAEERTQCRGMLLKFPNHIKRFLSIIIVMLRAIKDEPSWDDAESDEPSWDDAESDEYPHGIDSLVRIANALGGKVILSNYPNEFASFLGSVEWQSRHAAVTSLAVIAESCSKAMKENLGYLAEIVTKVMRDFHPRVRWAAINAIKEFSIHLGPEFQEQCHKKVLTALTTVMNDFQNPRVQMQAASAILFFSKNCTSNIITPYLKGIVSKLLRCLQKGKQLLKERALTALASIAYSSKDQFQEHYQTVMPYLKVIMMSAIDESNHILLATSMECITMVWMAVGKEKFRDDTHQVVQLLISSKGALMEPLRSHVLQAWGRLCKCLGKEFYPYLGVVIPRLIQSAQLKNYITISNDSDDAEVLNNERIKTITLGDKKVGIKTDVLEEKATACNVLCCCAAELKEGFCLWIDEVAHTLVPLLNFELHEDIQTAAISAMPVILHSSKNATEKGYLQGYQESPFKKLSAYIIPALVGALHKESTKEISARILDSLKDCIQISGPILNKPQVKNFIDEIIAILTVSSSKESGMEWSRIKDLDAEEQELLKDERELQENVYNKASNCLATFIKIYKASLQPFFDELLSCTVLIWGNVETATERRIAMRIFHDLAEQCHEEAFKYYESSLPLLIKACYNENPEVQEIVACGIGVCAEFGGSVFKPLVKEAISGLKAVVGHPNALHQHNMLAHDFAVSALGKICQFHHDSVNTAEAISTWLSHLPIKNDLDEAKIVHDQLSSMVEKSDRLLLGKDKANLPKLIAVYVEILWSGNNLATEETVSRLIKQLKHFREILPTAAWKSMQSSLQPYQQNLLHHVLSS